MVTGLRNAWPKGHIPRPTEQPLLPAPNVLSSAELGEWADVLDKVKVPIYVYANNHYAGYSPATVEMFRNL